MNPFTQWLGTATFWDWATNVSAFLSVTLLLLVVYGFRRYTVRPRTEPIDFMGTGIWLIALVNAMRLVFWDLIPDLFGFKWAQFGVSSAEVNWAFNLWALAGAWYMLKGFSMLVEARAPGQYNVFTAVFFPRRIRLTFTNRPKVGQEE